MPTEKPTAQGKKQRIDIIPDPKERRDPSALEQPISFRGDLGHRNFTNYCMNVDYPRIAGQMTFHVNAAGGIPCGGKSIGEVERAYFRLKELRETIPDRINAMHPNLHVDRVVGNSIYYAISCKSLGAVKCLWRKYETLGLNKLVTSVTITDKTLREISASYFSIQTTLDLEEYEQCKRELKDTPDDDPGEDFDEGKQTDPELLRRNRELKAHKDELESTVDSLQKRVDETKGKLDLLEATVKENNEIKVNIAILKQTVIERNAKIEALKQKLAEKIANEKVLMDKVMKLTKENNDLKAAREREEDPAVVAENIELKKRVSALKQKVQDLEEKSIEKQKYIDKLRMELETKGAASGSASGSS